MLYSCSHFLHQLKGFITPNILRTLKLSNDNSALHFVQYLKPSLGFGFIGVFLLFKFSQLLHLLEQPSAFLLSFTNNSNSLTSPHSLHFFA
nr:MAG TPA: hypothetical protein [Caudoviricetes sp.]